MVIRYNYNWLLTNLFMVGGGFMGKKLFSKIIIYGILLAFVFSNSGMISASAVQKKVSGKKTSSSQSLVKISSISNLAVSISQNGAYVLPKKVKAVLTNKKTIEVDVKWNTTSVKTDKAGSFRYIGKVKDYPKDVVLTLVVKALPIAITSVDKLEFSVTQNSEFKLPESIKVSLSNNTEANARAIWDINDVKTDTVGSFTFTGTLSDYSKSVTLTLIVNSIPVTISSIDALKTVEIKQNDKYALPDKITANMSDGSKKEVNITWGEKLDATVLGLHKFEGRVDGYSAAIKFMVLVRGLELSAPEKLYEEAKIGDIVGVKGSIANIPYEHFGIYIGNGEVIEYSSTNGKISGAVIAQNPMNKSFPTGSYFIYKLKDVKFTPEEIVERAKSRLGEKKYDLIGNNCENFAVWCQTDVSKSFQIDSHPVSDIELLDSMIDSPYINIK